MKLHMLTIFVTDFEIAKTYYSDLLSWSFIKEDNYHLEMRTEGTKVHFYLANRNTSPGDYSREARTVFVFETDNIEREMKILQSKGVQFLHVVPNENDFSRYAAFKDPFGNVHELCELKKHQLPE
ncbi:VOC family protein [Jeotgalibacillus salarius]|uniref:VOC family protein n=1 Tax=Jeotgalibacillus salarius TaxID=546023 RepID=A0A4Y8LIB2_9BACL|nr:VOC family protein [Jeotgalibacillus salarius]TFE02218.1 VOC family protein [Jeotgalibacillus salarius]